MGPGHLAARLGGTMALATGQASAAPENTGVLLAHAGGRWLRIGLAVTIVALVARTRAWPLAYLMLVPAALAIGNPAARANLDRWTRFWGGTTR